MTFPAAVTIRGTRPASSGNRHIDAHLRELVAELAPADAEIAIDIVVTALRMAREQTSRLDRKIVRSSLKELRHAFQVFAPYAGQRKVSIFGSARAAPNDAEFGAALDFARQIAERGWMVITGAGGGIMEAGNEGAGRTRSFGANIKLPSESKPNPHIADDGKLINFKYFFTRKLTLVKEAHAFALLPGGFGTMDEAFELLTLMQTGKSDVRPIVLLDRPGGTFWWEFERFAERQLLHRRYIDEEDKALYRMADDPSAAVAEIQAFYRVFHSQRKVNQHLVLRLERMPAPNFLASVSAEFADLIERPIEMVDPSPEEVADEDELARPRIALQLKRKGAGRLRRLIDRINEWEA